MPKSGLEDDDDWELISPSVPKDKELSSQESLDEMEKLTKSVCAAAGVGKEYLSFALKYLAVETARTAGSVINSRVTVDMVRKVKERFPALADVEEAYRQGKEKRGRQEKGEGFWAEKGEMKKMLEEEEDMKALGFQKTKGWVYDPERHAGLEVVDEVVDEGEEIWANEKQGDGNEREREKQGKD